MQLNSGNDPYGAMARGRGTAKSDKKVGKKTPKINSQAYKKGMMPKANPRGILKDNY